MSASRSKSFILATENTVRKSTSTIVVASLKISSLYPNRLSAGLKVVRQATQHIEIKIISVICAHKQFSKMMIASTRAKRLNMKMMGYPKLDRLLLRKPSKTAPYFSSNSSSCHFLKFLQQKTRVQIGMIAIAMHMMMKATLLTNSKTVPHLRPMSFYHM